MRHTLLALAALSSGLTFAAPALAEEAPEPKVNMLIIYGDDRCPESTDDVINVCAKKEEGERYRIPRELRESSSPSNEAWNNKVLAYETVGRGGTNSCSPVGAGGWTGCSAQLINAAYAEKKTSSDVRFGELIAAEREKRLSTIDADAAATQSRVEDAEKEHEARQRALEAEQEKAEADAAVPAELNAPPPKS